MAKKNCSNAGMNHPAFMARQQPKRTAPTRVAKAAKSAKAAPPAKKTPAFLKKKRGSR